MALNLNKSKIGQKILLIAVVCGTLGALNLFLPLSLGLTALQSKIAVKPVSGDIVVVGIDSPSISEVGRWPWPRDKQAELIRKIDAYGPASIYIDIGYQGDTTPSADLALRDTLQNLQAPIKVIASVTRTENGSVNTIFSNPSVVGSVDTVTPYMPYLFGFVWEMPTSIDGKQGRLPSVAASMAGLKDEGPSTFPINFAFDPGTIQHIPSKDVINQTTRPNQMKGKTVILGVTDIAQNDVHAMPGWGQQPGVFFHVLAAETIKYGLPQNWGWIAFFGAALGLSLIQLTVRGLKYSAHISWAGAASMLIISTWLLTLHIVNNPAPGLALIVGVGILIAQQKSALIRSQRNATTGYFNMTGYLVEEVVSNAIFIGANVTRAETRLGYVRQEDKIAIMKEVGHRLSTVIDEQQLTHNDDQQFFWEMPSIPTQKLSDHLEGMRQLFSEPLIIDGRKIDIDIHFGVDRNVNNNVKIRLMSALEASVDASRSQSTFKIATTLEFDALLRSQFSSEFETAINNGDIDLMLEAQKNLKNNAVESAAASLRWTHPAYGQIDTAKLFAMARDTGNLKRVSRYLCEQSIKSAGRLVEEWPDFAVSVKISTEVILSEGFGSEMLQCAQNANCSPANVTFEVLEIHEHKFSQQARSALFALQQLGFKIGIGNFGITDADIDFIKKFQPDEIVLAKSFSAELLGSTSNEIFAVGALRIASASHIITTADGIDDRDVLAALRRHSCARGRGKIIGIPMNLDSFQSNYANGRSQKFG
jgi:EAL domain-containing protein (putative c-di-GMP-specific phosphodiesterase class I)/CHASE2 domain-containing sensor protein